MSLRGNSLCLLVAVLLETHDGLVLLPRPIATQHLLLRKLCNVTRLDGLWNDRATLQQAPAQEDLSAGVEAAEIFISSRMAYDGESLALGASVNSAGPQPY